MFYLEDGRDFYVFDSNGRFVTALPTEAAAIRFINRARWNARGNA